MNNLKNTAAHAMVEPVGPVAQQFAALARRGLLVLGMHRSGTSALTGMLGKLGCVLPADIMGAGIGNEKGHWESEGAVAINDRILDSAGSNWEDWAPVNRAWFTSPFHSAAVHEVQESLRASFGKAPLFVLKDPRICRLLPVWLSAFTAEGIEPAIVICLRHPREVAASLEARDGMEHGYAYLLWLRYTLEAEVGTRGRKRVVCHFDQLKQDWQSLASRIGEELDIAWPRQSATSRHDIESFLARPHPKGTVASKEFRDLMPVAERAYAIFKRWSEAGEDSADYLALDQIFREFEAAGEFFASLILPGSRSLGPGGGHAMRDELGRAKESFAQLAAESSVRLTEYEAVIQDLEGRVASAITSEVEVSRRLEERGGQVVALQCELDTLGRAFAERQNEYEVRMREHADAARCLSLAESTLQQKEEEIVKTCGERDRAIEMVAQLPLIYSKLEEARADIFRMAAEREMAQEKVSRLRRSKRDLKRRLKAEISCKGRTEQALYDLKTQVGERETELHQLQLSLDYERTAKDRLHQAVLAAQAEFARHQGEMEQAASRLTQAEEMVLSAHNQQYWLTQVNRLLLNRSFWWSFIPVVWRRRRELNTLARHGLFDAKAYLEHNPDVAAAGVDPVRHYLCHGIIEGRRLPC